MPNKSLKILVLILFILIFCVSSFMAVREIVIAKNEDGALSELAEIAAENREKRREAKDNEVSAPPIEDSSADGDAAGEPVKPEQTVSWYDGLLNINGELFGWIEIPDTRINYPVMHTPNDPEKYLHTAFDGSYSKSGVPFLAGNCREGKGIYIVYGHNMRNGSMFHDLLSYKKESFWREHPTVYFDTINDEGEYEIIGAFPSKVYRVDETGVFKYYNYINLTDPEVFAEYVAEVKSASLYDTGVSAEYGDTLLVLSTCGSSNDTERFVVVARKTAE